MNHLISRLPQLALTLREASSSAIVEMLLQGESDLALVGMPAYDNRIAVQELFRERYVIAFPRAHRFARMDVVPLRELHGERYLERLNCENLDYFEQTFGDFGIELDVRYESEHEDWIQALIVAGMGCAVMPGYMAIYPELQRRPLVEPEIWRSVGLARARGRPNTPEVDHLARLCRDMSWGRTTSL